MNINNVPNMSTSRNSCTRCKLYWSRIKQNDINKYSVNTDTLLRIIKISTDALTCRDVHCKHDQHIIELCSFY